MKSFNYLRILFLAIISLSIISCTEEGGDDGLLDPQSPIQNKGYKKLVQMNIKGSKEEDRMYFNYDRNGTLSSIEYRFYKNGYLDSRDIVNFKYENNYILCSINGEEYEKLYLILDGKITNITYPNNSYFLKYDNNGCLASMYSEGNSPNNRETTVFTWEEGKLVSTTSNEVSYYFDPYTNSYSESHTTRSSKYTYQSHSPNRCNGFFPDPDLCCNLSVIFELCTAPWIIGLEQQELPEKREDECIYSSESKIQDIWEFSYTFYDNGYLKTCTTKHSYNFSSEAREGSWVTEYFWQ